ncbi:hypothetical protein [Streptomyces griseoluteus]|uniref:hypothetical protein n=1 Tax=Streptomyces griseoluteus TaxID=29306 RepID=UPI0036F7488C
MKKISTALAALGIAAAAALAAPAAAQAAPSAPATGTAKSAAAPNGYFYAWEHADRGGHQCAWKYDSGDWSTCGAFNMRNKASSLENRGYAGAYEDVDLFWGTWYSGSKNCLPNGAYRNNLTGIYFLWDGKSGQGQSMNDNISSHSWSNNC